MFSCLQILEAFLWFVLITLLNVTLIILTLSVSRLLNLADKGKDTRDYLAAAFPELNAWERAGADASSAGMVDAGFENQKELTKMQLDNQKEIRSEERRVGKECRSW